MKSRPRAPTRKTEEAVDHRQNNGSVKAVSPRHRVASSVLVCCNCCFKFCAGESHKDNVRCTAVEEQLKQKGSPTFAAQLHLLAHDLFWANLRVQHHLLTLDLAWPAKVFNFFLSVQLTFLLASLICFFP